MNEAIVAPAAGSTPIRKPMPVPRRIGMRQARQSARVGRALFTSATGRVTPSTELATTSPTPKRATVSTMNSTPSSSQVWPKSKRAMPFCGSMPMVPRSSPATPVTRPLRREEPTAASAVSPSTTSAKYSGGPKASAALASAGASSIRPIVPRVPAMNEPIAAMPSAGPARPCSASW